MVGKIRVLMKIYEGLKEWFSYITFLWLSLNTPFLLFSNFYLFNIFLETNFPLQITRREIERSNGKTNESLKVVSIIFHNGKRIESCTFNASCTRTTLKSTIPPALLIFTFVNASPVSSIIEKTYSSNASHMVGPQWTGDFRIIVSDRLRYLFGKSYDRFRLTQAAHISNNANRNEISDTKPSPHPIAAYW